jgi:hypothetical protein
MSLVEGGAVTLEHLAVFVGRNGSIAQAVAEVVKLGIREVHVRQDGMAGRFVAGGWGRC